LTLTDMDYPFVAVQCEAPHWPCLALFVTTRAAIDSTETGRTSGPG
jgi:hypothetical protein